MCSEMYFSIEIVTAWKISVFSPNTEKYGPEITPYLDTFHSVRTANGGFIVDRNKFITSKFS